MYSRFTAFGVPLTELMTKNEREKTLDIPSFITEALDTIDTTGTGWLYVSRQHTYHFAGIEVEGIFRVSGSVVTIRHSKEAINQGI